MAFLFFATFCDVFVNVTFFSTFAIGKTLVKTLNQKLETYTQPMVLQRETGQVSIFIPFVNSVYFFEIFITYVVVFVIILVIVCSECPIALFSIFHTESFLLLRLLICLCSIMTTIEDREISYSSRFAAIAGLLAGWLIQQADQLSLRIGWRS